MKTRIFEQILKNKAAAQKSGFGILGQDLARQFKPGQKPLPGRSYGGRNGNGKPS